METASLHTICFTRELSEPEHALLKVGSLSGATMARALDPLRRLDSALAVDAIHGRMRGRAGKGVGASQRLPTIHHVERVDDQVVNIAERLHTLVKGSRFRSPSRAAAIAAA